MLRIDGDLLIYDAPSIRSTGTGRYAPSFSVRLSTIKIVGYVPRLVIDDETEFLVMATSIDKVYYFNFDVIRKNVSNREVLAKLQHYFGYCIKEIVPDIPYEEYNKHSFIIYPASLIGQPVFKSCHWSTLSGVLNNFRRFFTGGHPKYERLSEEAQAFLATTF